MNLSLTPESLNLILMFGTPAILALWITSGFVFTYTLVKHRKVDSKILKHSFVKSVTVASAFILCALVLASLVANPIGKAETVATTGYYLSRPIPIADWYVGKFSSGNYFAINGSNWNDLVDVEPWQAVPPWAAYATNATRLVQECLASITYGEVYLKEAQFNYSLTIPANVQVVENRNGLTRTFVDSASSQGSPYTISVDNVVSGYYLAQDSANRYISSWSSTNCSYVTNTIISSLGVAGGHISFASGSFTLTKGIVASSSSWSYPLVIEGAGMDNTVFNVASGVNQNAFTINGQTGSAFSYYVTLKDFAINFDAGNTIGDGLKLVNIAKGSFENLLITNVPGIGINCSRVDSCTFSNNFIELSGSWGMKLTGAGGNLITHNKFFETVGGLYIYDDNDLDTVINPICDQVMGIGIDIEGSSQGATHTIIAPLVGGSDTTGIYIYNSNVQITGGTVYASDLGLHGSWAGIFANGNTNLTVTGTALTTSNTFGFMAAGNAKGSLNNVYFSGNSVNLGGASYLNFAYFNCIGVENSSVDSILTLSKGLVAYLPMDEGTGTTTRDWSGYGVNGAVTGGTWSANGKYSNALMFNGTTDYVTLSKSVSMTGVQTITFWFNNTNTAANTCILGNTVTTEKIFFNSADNNFYIRMTNGGTLTYHQIGYTGATMNNTWHFIAITRDSTNNVKVYFDGSTTPVDYGTMSGTSTGIWLETMQQTNIGKENLMNSEYIIEFSRP